MKTQELIQNLSENLRPVSILPSSRIRLTIIIVAMIAAMSMRFFLVPNRPDLQDFIKSASFIYSSLAFILGWLACAYSLSQLQLPAHTNNKRLTLGIIAFTSLVVGFIISGLTPANLDSFLPGAVFITETSCSLDIAYSSFIPVILLVFILRSGAATNRNLVGINIGLACTILGAYMLQFSCTTIMPSHVLIWHLLVPAILTSGVSLVFAKVFMRW